MTQLESTIFDVLWDLFQVILFVFIGTAFGMLLAIMLHKDWCCILP